jgi:hypothetical protein
VDACNDPTASNTALILCFILREEKTKVKRSFRRLSLLQQIEIPRVVFF